MNISLPRHWYKLKSKIEVRIIWNIQTALSFWAIGLRALFGKIIIIDTKETKSKGGYKYLAIIISKCPTSKYHTYEDL